MTITSAASESDLVFTHEAARAEVRRLTVELLQPGDITVFGGKRPIPAKQIARKGVTSCA
jgi:hypothetical protein